MKGFQRANNIAGWLIFVFASLVYILTMEGSASFWDCGEFISAAYKLQVVHPPGAPIFLMVGRLFILLGGGPQHADTMMNLFSALSSSASILFLFWSITYFARKVLVRDGEWNEYCKAGERDGNWSDYKTAAAIATGVIGATVGTFMTSLWFSAVEAEVYALATFFYALIFWAMTKWDRVADEPGADRWLLFIALMLGLSGGVHLLSLLVIPAVVFLYYFRKFPVTRKGIAAAAGLSIGLLVFILYFVLDYLIAIAAKLDVFFVNDLGAPVLTGIILFSLLLIVGLAWGIRRSAQLGKQWVNTALLSMVFLLMGFSSYAMVLIRAAAEPSINMNGITDVTSFLSYLKREQYGSRDLFMGTYFTARPVSAEDAGPIYSLKDGKYEVVGQKKEYVYDIKSVYPNLTPANTPPELASLIQRNKKVFFPRMGSPEGRHLSKYYAFLGLSDAEGANYIPTYGDNIRYFFDYQMGYMFWRYFMWNFSGRQNDRQGYLADGYKNGNWITGFEFIDKVKHPQLQNLPISEKEDVSRNTYYLLPFLLGLIGMVWQYRNDKRGFVVVFIFFFFMGVMNLVNSNQPPIEPRERDYALVGAFFAFAMWVGMGVLGLLEMGKDKKGKIISQYIAGIAAFAAIMFLTGLTQYALMPFVLTLAIVLLMTALLGGISIGLGQVAPGKPGHAVIIALLCGAAPLVMGFQNWGNHNRSNRTFAKDIAGNYLNSCQENAILFTQGDNDTYPLWYAQEVENVRPDVRIINLSLLGVYWYINALRRAVNDSGPVPMTLTEQDVQADNNVYIEFDEESKFKDQRIDASRFVRFIQESPNPYVPTRQISFPVDRQKVIDNGIVTQEESPFVVPLLTVNLNKKSLYKNDLMTLDIIAATNWDRPIYFAMTVQSDAFLGLEKYFRHDGMCYKFVPVEKPDDSGRRIGYKQNMNTQVMYDLIMSDKFHFGGIENGDPIYKDPSALNAALSIKYLLFQQLAFDLINEAARADAIENMLGQFNDSISMQLDPETGAPFSTSAERRQQAVNVLDKMLTVFPSKSLAYDVNMVGIGNMLLELGERDKAEKVADETARIVASDLDWLLTLNGVRENDVQAIYMRDLFGNQPSQGQLMCNGESSLARLGALGSAASLIRLYEDLELPDKAEALRNQCAASWRANMPLYWPPYLSNSCQRMLQESFGVAQ